MSLNRLPLRISNTISRQCVRPLSTSAQRCAAQSLLEVLGAPAKEPKRDSLRSFARDTLARNPAQVQQDQEKRQALVVREDYGKQLYRRWEAGDVYAPHDLTGREQAKWKRGKKAQKTDAIDALGINPLLEYKNFTMMSEYMTEMGRIKHSSVSGLRPVNQRKMAKALRRAIGLGLMPSVHRHPLALKAHRSNRFH